MLFSFLRLNAGSPASRSPLAASSEDEKSSSPESPPRAPGLLASLLPSVFQFRGSCDSDVDCADSTSASGDTVGTDGCTNSVGTATAESGASSRASKNPSSSRSVRFASILREERIIPRPGVADQRWYLDESLGDDIPKKSAQMKPPSCGLMKATSSSCREPLGSGYVIVEGRVRRYSHRLRQKALKESSKSI